MEQETKKCPYCGEEIMAAAKKCWHCGKWFESAQTLQKEIKGQPVKRYYIVRNPSPELIKKSIHEVFLYVIGCFLWAIGALIAFVNWRFLGFSTGLYIVAVTFFVVGYILTRLGKQIRHKGS